MTLRLLSWNDIVCLQETKLSSVNSAILRSLLGSPSSDWAVLNAVQSSGGFC